MDRNKQRYVSRFKRFKRRFEMSRGVIKANVAHVLLATTFIIGVLVFGFIVFSPIIQVREIQVTRLSSRLDVEDVQEALTPMFGKHLFFLSSFEIAGLLRDSIPDIEQVGISKTYPSTLHVTISLDPLGARLHIKDPEVGDAAVIGTGATVDFLTSRGIYVTTTAAKDTEILPEIVIVDWGVRPEPGSVLLKTAMLERMNAAELTLLRQFGQELQRRTVYLRAQEFHLRVSDIELWFDLKSPLEEQFQRYRTFLQQVPFEEIKRYVDLRIKDKVAYQ